MKSTRPVLILAALALLVSGCGGSSDDVSNEPTDPTSSATSEPTARTLRETCPEVEAALPGNSLPTGRQLRDFAGAVAPLYEAGDTETQNALELLITPLTGLIEATENNETGQPFISARAGFRGAIDDLANRCEAAGSSAFQ